MQNLVPGGAKVRQFILSHSGAVAVEFAIVLPPLILVLFVIIAFASTLFLHNNMVNAAREAVRQMAVVDASYSSSPTWVACDAPEAQIVDSVESVACAYLTFWGTDFIVNAADNCSTGGDKARVRIRVGASQAALMDIFGFFDGKTLRAEVTMRKEDLC